MTDQIRKLHSRSLSGTVYDELLRLISARVLEPGQRLNEVHLAEQFGISRGPVREAARELEGQGLLVSRPRQGFYVADFTPKEIRDLYEVKRWIDPAIINDVLTYMAPAGRAAIRADIDTIHREDKMQFSESLFAYRSRMVARLHNRFLATQALTLYRQFHVVTALIVVDDPKARIARIVATLEALWDALTEGDRARALAVMEEDAAFWERDVAPRFAKPDTDQTELPDRSA